MNATGGRGGGVGVTISGVGVIGGDGSSVMRSRCSSGAVGVMGCNTRRVVVTGTGLGGGGDVGTGTHSSPAFTGAPYEAGCSRGSGGGSGGGFSWSVRPSYDHHVLLAVCFVVPLQR